MQSGYTILVVEDDSLMSDTIHRVLTREGYRVRVADTGTKAKKILEGSVIHLILLDIRLPDMSGLDLLAYTRENDPDISVIVMTAYSDVKVAVDAMKAGASDYLQKPFELEELKVLISRALENVRLKSELVTFRQEHQKAPSELIGESRQIKTLREMIRVVAKTPRTPVLIMGESGTGKELVASAIHKESERKDSPLVRINVSAIPENLLESEFFGYKKGAFTDAKENKKGLFEMAHRGTLFLDEVGEMKLSLQPKLLRFLETQTFTPVGATNEISVDVRVITATNQDLAKLVEENKFRNDLYYRLKVMLLEVPPLREHKDDIPVLVDRFLSYISRELRKNVKSVSREVLDVFMDYHWPGNVRELKNVIERAIILTESDQIGVEDLSLELVGGKKATQEGGFVTLEEVEREHIMHTVGALGGNKSEAARTLGISRSTLIEKMKRYGLS